MLSKCLYLPPLLLAFVPQNALSAESYDNCTGFIDSLPAVISTQGTWCLRKDLATSVASGNAVTITTNNVTVDCNDFKLGGLAAGPDTLAQGIYALDRSNLTVRNCKIRGFRNGVFLVNSGANGIGGGHVVEDNLINANTLQGVVVYGDGSVVQRNRVLDTGGSHSAAVGITTSDSVDILDNTVNGVSAAPGGGDVFGISAPLNSGSISGNRVRGVVAVEAAAIGIYTAGPQAPVIRDNELSGDSSPSSTAIACELWESGVPSRARARGNMISGFGRAIYRCGDAGSNDVTP